MTRLGSDDHLQLDRLTLHGSGGDTARARRQLELELASVRTGLSGLPPRAILVVRRLVIEGPGALPLAQRTSRRLQAFADTANRPWLQPDAFAADAVLFLDEIELAACLVSDALQGRIRAHWWWRAVLAGRSAQVWLRGEVLANGQTIVPVVAQLAVRSQAVRWAQQWSEADAATGLAALGQAHGWMSSYGLDAPVANGFAGAMGPCRTSAAHANRTDVDRVLTTAPELRNAQQLTAPAAHLLAASLLLSRDPAWLRSARGTAACASWVALRRHQGVHSPPFAVVADRKSVETARPAGLPLRAPVPHATAVPPSSRARFDPVERATRDPLVPDVAYRSGAPLVVVPKSNRRIRQSRSLAKNHVQRTSRLLMPSSARESSQAMPPRLLRPIARNSVAPAHASHDATDTSMPDVSMSKTTLRTDYGGLFYLLNVTLALELYGDFSQPLTPGLPLSPWNLLAWMGRAWFGRAIERDPVWPLLADLAGRRVTQPPGRDFVPPCPSGIAGDWVIDPAWLTPWGPKPALRSRTTTRRAQVRHLAGFMVRDVALDAELRPRARRAIWLRHLLGYVQARSALTLGIDGAEVPDLLCRHAAELHVSAAALDVKLSLDALPLAVRLAGLDRDPGWIPATGRSVRFHFR